MEMPINPGRNKQQGFGILEVMIAVAVLSIAMLSLGGLHTLIIQSSSQAKSRTLATSLAQQKLDDLRSFGRISDDIATVADECAAGTFCYTEIDASDSTDLKLGGGEENADGTLKVEAHYAGNEITFGADAYTLRWELEGDYYYCANSAPTTTNCASPKLYPDFKRVKVIVTWTDKSGNQQLDLESVISATAPISSGLSGVAGTDFGPPIIRPGVCADCIPNPLGDGKVKESSKPQPDTTVHKHSTVTTFDEVTYNSTTRELFDRSEFVTLNCVCQQEGTPGANDPVGRNPVIFDGEKYILNDPDHPTYPSSGEENSSKRFGSTYRSGQFNEQPAECDICCRDHHDQTAPTAGNAATFATVYDPFRPAPGVDANSDGLDDNYHSSGDHTHFYDTNNDGVLEPADDVGNQYYEACKMVRLGGSLRVVQDWNLQAMQVIPSSQLTGATLTNYQEYVAAYVTEFIKAQTSAYPETTVDVSSNANVLAESNTFRWDASVTYPAYEMDVGDTEDFVARAIYLDYMTPELLNTLKCKINGSGSNCTGIPVDTGYLGFVPFHEVNVTRLANWSSSDSTNVTVTNEAIEQGTENTYSRGDVTAVSDGSSDVTASIERSNTGLTDSNAIDTNDNAFLNDSVAVEVAVPTPPYTCSDAATHCVSGKVDVAANSDGRQPSDIQVLGAGGASCTYPDPSLGTNYYTCVLSATGDGTITFANINSITPQDNCVDPNPNAATGMSVGNPVNDGIYGTFSTGEYRVFTFSGRTSDLSLNVNIKKAAGTCP